MRTLVGLVFLFTVLLVSCDFGTSKEEQIVQSKIDKCSWLVGKWQDTLNSNQWEVWEKRGDSLFGFAAYIKGEDTSVFELLSILENDGQLIYTALIMKNKKAVSFRNTTIGEDFMVFENPEHDFPKMITYQYTPTTGGDYLMASVSANMKKFDFGMIKRR